MGPVFVGLGLEGELTDKWTKYKPRNAVEQQYVWKLHPPTDLGVPLAVSAMDWEGCYTDPERKEGEKKKEEGTNAGGGWKETPIHPDDDALIHWKGSMGDTAAEQLQQRRDRLRAAARLALAQGSGTPLPLSKALTPITTTASTTAFKLKKKHHLHSRILDEKTPNFMKKTTYLTNDATSVHRFTSLAKTQEERARNVDKAIADTKSRYTKTDIIAKGFNLANSCGVIAVGAASGGESENKKKRAHPTKKGVVPVWDMPLLPDVPTWGHTYTHVVLDNPPKSVKANTAGTKKGKSLVDAQQLQKAIVADVTQQVNNNRMACTVWVPNDETPADEKENSDESAPKKLEGDPYQAVQRYDLDVVPLRDASGPPVHFVLVVDPNRNYVGYHPVGSRVQLSTGRPVVLPGTSQGGNDTEIATDKTHILRRAMESDEKKDIEKRMAEIDVDMAEKHGMLKEDDAAGENLKRRSSGGNESGAKEDDDMDEDAF